MTLYGGWGDIVGAALITLLAVSFGVVVSRLPETESHKKRPYFFFAAAIGAGAIARWLYVFTSTSVVYHGMFGVSILLLGVCVWLLITGPDRPAGTKN